MPVLPSGRRIEFSLDRFHALLGRMDEREAKRIAASLDDADDLLPVLDAVHFSLKDGTPYFAGYVAADWAVYAADWNAADRQALRDWLASATARAGRADALRYIKSLLHGRQGVPYPYAFADDAWPPGAHAASSLRQ